MKTKKEPLKQYNERETSIRNRIYTYGLFALTALVLIDLIFRDKGTPWAQGQYNHLIYVAAVFALVSIAFAVCGVYYGRHKSPAYALIVALLCVLRWSLSLSSRVSAMRMLEEPAIENGALTRIGTYHVVDCIVIFAGVCIAIRAMIDIIKNMIQKKKTVPEA